MIIDGYILFKLHDTIGFPIDISCRMVYERNYDINWYRFVEAAEDAGWTFDKTIGILEEHVKREPEDVYRAICLCGAISFNDLRAKRAKK